MTAAHVIGAVTRWSTRRWLVVLAGGVTYLVLVAVATAMIETPLFGRDVPPTWWSWPALVVAAILAGLLCATYVRQEGVTAESREPGSRRGMAGAVLTWFAVGCPVCNKLALLALGYAGALTWFQPIQPFLYVAALALLGWALVTRLRGELVCPLPARVPTSAR